MLGSGGSLVADAISSFPSYSSFKRFNTSVLTMASGDLYFKPDDTSTFGTATVLLPIPSGKTYRLDMIGNFNIYSGSASLEISLFKTNPDNVVKVLYSGAVAFSRKTFNWEIDGSDDLYILIRMKGNCAFWWNSAGFVDQSTDTGILNSIKEGFSKLWEWLKGIWDSIKEIPTKIAASLTALGDRIRTFFSDLVDNMRNFFSSLGDRISGFFNDIWEKIKAFFLPSEGYFDEYSVKFNLFIDEHFGFLADFPDELSLLFNTIVDFEPSDPPYIDFPDIKLPLLGKTYTIVEHQRYTFDFLATQPFSTLYSAYQAFVWLAYCLMLINLIRRKYAVVFGGSANAD